MSTAAPYRHLSIDADGSARIEGTRYKVIHLAGEHYHHGWSAEEILHQHPDLRPEQVYAALAYFYDNWDLLTKQMAELSETVQNHAANQPLSRSELLQRKQSRESDTCR